MAEDRSHGIVDKVQVEDGLAWIDALAPAADGEDILLAAAAGRILARDANATLDLPPVDRAAVDGIALHAEATIGASIYNPCVLQWTSAPSDLAPGDASRVNAGDLLPDGADAVIRWDHVGLDALGRVNLTEPTTAGNGVERKGSQAARGSLLIAAGQRLTAADIGLLASAGLAHVGVRTKPRVRCLIAEGTVQAGNRLPHGEIYDANRPLLAALIERDGGIVLEQRTIARDRAVLRNALSISGADLVLVVGGTGSGSNDQAAAALAEAGELAIHGVALRHAETFGMGLAAGVPTFLLPGNPVACLLAYELFAGRAIRRFGGQNPAFPFSARQMTTTRKIVSEIGVLELRPVRCPSQDLAEPVAFFVEAGLKAFAQAHGFVVIPEKSEGYPRGTIVTVYLYNGYGSAQSQ
jgi:molybdopterin molybdotransferase